MIYNLDSRCQQILKNLVYANDYQGTQSLCDEFKISKRSFYYDLNKINEWLDEQEISIISVERKLGILLTNNQKEDILAVLKKNNNEFYVFKPIERVMLIICLILNRNKALFVEDFMALTQVSRNTILNDIKQIAGMLKDYDLELIYENKEGYHVIGDVIKKRSVFFLLFSQIAQLYKQEVVTCPNMDKVNEIERKLKEIELKLDTSYVSGVLFSIAMFFANIEFRKEELVFSIRDRMEIAKTKEYQYVIDSFNNFASCEQYYLTLHLLGSRLQTVPINLMNENDSEANFLASHLVNEFSRLACIEFDNKQEIIKAVAAHLKSSLYRYRYGIQLGNPMLDDIKNEYKELFELTKTACKYLEKQIGVPIPDGEVAYLTLHFGGYMRGDKTTKLNILIVCPNGISTGNMLRGEVINIIPQASNIKVVPLSEYWENNKNFNLTISTVPIESDENIIVVHPILTDNDRVNIMRHCMNKEQIGNYDIKKIIKIASKYIQKEKMDAFVNDLQHYFSSQTIRPIEKKYGINYGILHYLSDDHIMVYDQEYSWQEAISEVAKPLLSERVIESAYVDAIINRTIELGPCMFITNQVVLAHAKIDEGSLGLGVTFGLFKHPVIFDDDRKASIILMLSAENQTSHIKVLNDIMEIFSHEENINDLSCAKNEIEIISCLENILSNSAIE